jgi:transcription initiation factor TFIID subunit 15
MGQIPAFAKTVSTVILNPKNLDTIPEKTTFNISVNIANMALGSFTNATSTYYSAPQTLDGQGRIIGHTHVTVQDTGSSLNPSQPLDGTKFTFFKGINDAGNGNGLLTTAVTGGLPAGNYRVCSMAGAANHQPVLMAVAQRGAQDDCKYFTVAAAGGGNGGNGGNAAAGGTNNAAGGGNAGNGKGGNGAAASSSAAAASTSAAAAGGNGGGNGGGRGGKGNGGNGAAASSSAAAASTSAAAAGGNGGGNGGGRGGKGNGGNGSKAATTSSAAAAATSAAASTGKGASGTNNAASGSSSAALGGIAAPAVTNSSDKSRPFAVNGDTFVNQSAAKQRACAIQNNQCADAVNSGKMQGKSVTDCNNQETACNAA